MSTINEPTGRGNGRPGNDGMRSALAIGGALTVALGAGLAGEAKAAVITTDIDPDFTLGSYDLDLDNNGTTDFTFSRTLGSGAFVDGGSNAVLTDGFPTKGTTFAAALGAGTTIGPNPFLFTSGSSALFVDIDFGPPFGIKQIGPWTGPIDAFIGLQFDIGGNTHYGWVEANADGGNVTLERYAYEDQANTPIVTPALATAVPEPGSLALLATGAAGLLALGRRRRAR